MPKRSSIGSRQSTASSATPRKNPAAVSLGRLGGLKGGKARAASLAPERRSDIAKTAAQARWSSGSASGSKTQSRAAGTSSRKEVIPMGKRGRDAKTGQFIPVKEAERRPSTTVIETVKSPKKKKR